MIRESEIIHERGSYWVLRTRRSFDVMQCGLTHSTTVQSFAPSADGKSLAIAYCDYKGQRT